jgi:SAM-dependent methyltransferase
MELGQEDNLLSNTYESGNLIAKVYFRWKVMTAIKLAGLRKDDLILDYGCGDGWLEHKLKNYNIVGYDLNPEKTFIDDYRKVKPTKIFVLDVFEHVPVKVIREIIGEFKKMGNFELIVSQPTENWLSRKVRKMLGKKEVPNEHITRYEEIIEILEKEFKLVKRVNFFTVCHIFLFRQI